MALTNLQCCRGNVQRLYLFVADSHHGLEDGPLWPASGTACRNIHLPGHIIPDPAGLLFTWSMRLYPVFNRRWRWSMVHEALRPHGAKTSHQTEWQAQSWNQQMVAGKRKKLSAFLIYTKSMLILTEKWIRQYLKCNKYLFSQQRHFRLT